MNSSKVTRSKFLSLVLRHKPETIGLTLDAEGWADVDDLLARAACHGAIMTRPELDDIVATSEKKRFAISEDGRRIRANQGHSIDVDLNLQPIAPPEFLYHGTVEKFLESIRAQGLLKGQRHHVHLSADRATAEIVGKRRGQPIILTVLAAEMARAGLQFYRSDNDVWLTDHVPPAFLRGL
jgi:putative RNA 2'-phosphotransferase